MQIGYLARRHLRQSYFREEEWHHKAFFLSFHRGQQTSHASVGPQGLLILFRNEFVVGPLAAPSGSCCCPRLHGRHAEGVVRRLRPWQIQRRITPERKCPRRTQVGSVQLAAVSQAFLFEQGIAQHEILGLPQRTAQGLVLVEQRIEESQRKGPARSRNKCASRSRPPPPRRAPTEDGPLVPSSQATLQEHE